MSRSIGESPTVFSAVQNDSDEERRFCLWLSEGVLHGATETSIGRNSNNARVRSLRHVIAPLSQNNLEWAIVLLFIFVPMVMPDILSSVYTVILLIVALVSGLLVQRLCNRMQKAATRNDDYLAWDEANFFVESGAVRDARFFGIPRLFSLAPPSQRLSLRLHGGEKWHFTFPNYRDAEIFKRQLEANGIIAKTWKHTRCSPVHSLLFSDFGTLLSR